MKNLELYIELMNCAQTAEEAFEALCRAMRQEGYDRVAYSLVTDHPSLGLPRQHGLATSYPEDWMKYYTEKDYMAVDPVTARVRESRKPFFWKDVMSAPDLAKPSLTLMEEAADSGVADGIGISLCGQGGELVGVGLARSTAPGGKAIVKPDYEVLASAHLLAVFFHETYRDMLTVPAKVRLTPREIEVLSWAAESKTDDEIASILTISENTVRFHWKNIFRKLGANGRVYAVMKAIRLQLISPTFVGTPYRNR